VADTFSGATICPLEQLLLLLQLQLLEPLNRLLLSPNGAGNMGTGARHRQLLILLLLLLFLFLLMLLLLLLPLLLHSRLVCLLLLPPPPPLCFHKGEGIVVQHLRARHPLSVMVHVLVGKL
jgi:hypothetical protein